jgi:hypothetical protein
MFQKNLSHFCVVLKFLNCLPEKVYRIILRTCQAVHNLELKMMYLELWYSREQFILVVNVIL